VFAAMLGKQGHTEDALKQVDRILQRKPNHRTALQLRALLTDELGPDNKK
jgi:uncharacterized protein HemY